jgi:nucleoside-diphosphate-sugar epimerase
LLVIQRKTSNAVRIEPTPSRYFCFLFIDGKSNSIPTYSIFKNSRRAFLSAAGKSTPNWCPLFSTWSSHFIIKIPKKTKKIFGDHPYDASKAATDILSATYYKTYKLPVVIARFGNIFGPGDINFSRIVPGAMEAILKNQILEIRSNGEFRRDYLYVKDVAEGYIKMAENLGSIQGEAFNFSSGLNMSVIELVEKIGEVAEKKCEYKILNKQNNEIPNQSLNFEKATRLLKWQASKDIQSQLFETFDWYKKYFNVA